MMDGSLRSEGRHIGGSGFDILRRIADRRRERIAAEGHALGAEVPARRQVPVADLPGAHGPGARGAASAPLLICEIKRRSPSRGEIDGVADPVARALDYAARGAGAISVLTEADHFGGSLEDLMAVKRALSTDAGSGTPRPADRPGGVPVLRKDFILDEEDVEVSYRAGADIVLLIATLLEEETLARLHARVTGLGMAALVELYTAADAEKARAFAPALTGINSRDLATFRVDRLHPLAVAAQVDWPTRLVYESGVFHGEDARLTTAAGFSGLLVGEAVVREPALIGELRDGLAWGADRRPAPRGDFWSRLARARAGRRAAGPRVPMVKVCGITNRADAEAAVEAGADILGLVFADSPRAAPEALPVELAGLDVLKVAVVVAGAGRPVPQPVRRGLEAGLIDAVQLHGDETPEECVELAFPYYKAVRLRGPEDVERVAAYRSPRVLVDAFDRQAYGGTGRRIRPELVEAVSEHGPVWMAGGIGVENVGEIIAKHGPELIDASSLLEAEPGRKDHHKLKTFFEEIEHAAGIQRLLR
jgi:indole-3-glycerol phosphate synthase/phosphoribosylanthranilate isomerase